MLKKPIASLMTGCAILLGAGVALVGASAPAAAQEEGEESRSSRRSETLSPATGRVLQSVFEKIQAEQFREALAEINEFINGGRFQSAKAYDKAQSLEIRGQIYINLENYRAALNDFQAAVQSGGFPPDRNNQLRYNIAQIHFQLEQYQQAINGLNAWIQSNQQSGGTVDPNAYYLLAAAYTQISPPNYRAAVGPAERVIQARGSSDPKKSDYDLLNLIYSELGESAKRASLLEQMINYFPDQQSYWAQLSGLYSQTGRDQEAFAVLEVAYRAGLIEREGQIVTLVNYYSFFDNPWRGAKLLEREIEAGRVERDLQNLILLSQLYSQSREQKRAIPVLREASQMSDRGELSYRLGQVLLADEQYVQSERALRRALNKGGMNRRQTGDAWLLLGTAQFSQAGPGDRAIRARARRSFVNATRYEGSRRQAGEWVSYIDAITQTEEAQDELERQQRIQAVRDNIERLRTQLQVCRLQGGEDCGAFEQRIEEARAQLAELENAPRDEEEAATSDDADEGDAAAAEADGEDGDDDADE